MPLHERQRTLPPTWLMGLTNCTWGLMGGFSVVTLPQMLAAQGVPGGTIGAFTATLLWPSVLVAFVSPMLDIRFSRRTYALIAAMLTAAAVMFTVMHPREFRTVEVVMLAGYTAAALFQGAVGGWMGSLIPPEEDGRLGVWFAVGNTGAGGVMMFLGALLLHLPARVAACALGAVLMLPTLLFLFIPAPGPDRKLAGESFRQFWVDVRALLKRREVLLAMVLFVLPCASFALTNVLGGVGRDFSASERLVGFSAGVGSVFAGVAGSFALKPLARRLPLRPIYLGVGLAGGLFTAVLLLLPRTPAVFAVAITGENLLQAMAFATANAITFETMGPGNPLAATLFTVLVGLTCLPIVYMGYLDSQLYKLAGISGSFAIDAGLSIAVCAVLAFALRKSLWTRVPGHVLDGSGVSRIGAD
jgi:PAT family beta-lactamase induction signal transducer AmpG